MSERATGGWVGPTAALLGVTLAVGTVLAVYRGEMPVARATGQLVLGMATIGFLGGFTRELYRGEWPRLETNWGGLGGGLGGWRMSPALACLLGALVFGGVFAASSVDRAEAPATPAEPESR